MGVAEQKPYLHRWWKTRNIDLSTTFKIGLTVKKGKQ